MSGGWQACLQCFRSGTDPVSSTVKIDKRGPGSRNRPKVHTVPFASPGRPFGPSSSVLARFTVNVRRRDRIRLPAWMRGDGTLAMEQLLHTRRPSRHRPSHARNSGLTWIRPVSCFAVVGGLMLVIGIAGRGGPAGVADARAAVPPSQLGDVPAPGATSALSLAPLESMETTVPAATASSSATDLGPARIGDAFPASGLAADGIPVTALRAYTQAAWRESQVSPECNLSWLLLAGIGRVESDHGRFAGAVLYSDGLSVPPVIGIPLNGNGTALILDTDGGALDGDPVYDRAVGPMQFIPSTWASWGVDANGDGVKDPFNIFDAAAAAADYLCAAGGDLSTTNGQVRAILSYNWSWDYVRLVMGVERSYANGAVGITVPVLPTTPDPGGGAGHPTLPPVDPGKPRGVPSGTSPPPATSPAPHPTSAHNPAPSTSGSQPGSPSGTSSSSSSSSAPGGGSSSSSDPSSSDPSSSDPSSPAPSSSDPQPCSSDPSALGSSSPPDPSCPSPTDLQPVVSAAVDPTDVSSSAAAVSSDPSSSGP
jgi:membrane-bound lytic murein transglycosylase B